MSLAVLSAHRPSVRAGVLAALVALLLPVLAVSGSSPARASSCDASSGAGTYGGGTGDPGTPYLLCSPDHLAHLAATSADWGDDFLQTDDITLPVPAPGSSNHVPIGNGTTSFAGVYDGGGNAITGLTIVATVREQGMFGVAEGATLKDLRLVDVDIEGLERLGGLLGFGESPNTIAGVSVSGTVSGTGGFIGGLVGQNNGGSITDSSSTATVTSTSGSAASIGGLVGQNVFVTSCACISDSHATGAVTGFANVGGLVGNNAGGEIARSYATGPATSTGGRAVGGLAGRNGNVGGDVGKISDSFATGPVLTGGTFGGRGGGLVGDNDNGEITRSYATGSVTGPSSGPVGGLVGRNRSSGKISDSYSSGPVTGPDEVGGLVGENQNGGSDAILRTFAVGSVTGDSSPTGGLIGTSAAGDPVTASFWDTRATGQTTSAGGTGAQGESTAAMTSIVTYSGATSPWSIVAGWEPFDLSANKIWGIESNVSCGYPFLLWQFTSTPAPTEPCGSTPTSGGSETSVVPTYFAPGGVLPSQAAGLGEWVQADGSSTPLALSSPGPNQVRYSAEGVQVTFTGGAGSDASRGLVANPAGEVVCEVCLAMAAGQVVEVWMFSEPRLVAAHLTEDLPCQRFSVPVVSPLDGGGPVEAGAHTLQLALPTAQGMQAVNVGVTVGGPVPASVPAGEGPVGEVTLAWGRLFLLLGLLGGVGAARTSRRERQVVIG